MARLTNKNVDGYFVSGINGKSWSDKCGRIYGEHIDKLAEYEDLEEQREKGCDFCNNYNFSNAKIEVDENGARILLSLCNTKFSKEKQFKLCPMCGRKLI